MEKKDSCDQTWTKCRKEFRDSSEKTYLFVNLCFIYLFIYLFIHTFIHLFIYLFIHLIVY